MAAPATFRTETTVSTAILGREVTITGEIRSQEPLIIEGEVEGSIDVAGHLLTIAANGNVRASVKATEIDVRGSLEGAVEAADKICIRTGGQFVGDIHAQRIVIEDGGFIRGRVELSGRS